DATMFTAEVWLTPLILLPGVALLIVSTTTRFGQMQTEFHHLLDRPDSYTRILARCLIRRSRLYGNALACLYASVGLFALGSLLGGVVNLWRPESLWVVGGFIILGITCIVYAATQLLRESLLSLQVIENQNQQIDELSAKTQIEDLWSIAERQKKVSS
ncbi:MAG: DUF2721 domain-containing protein, partial [Chloroflexales bacterium]|nr:DUF2721 domain-containing protein [Chloroflexales bacterium]